MLGPADCVPGFDFESDTDTGDFALPDLDASSRLFG